MADVWYSNAITNQNNGNVADSSMIALTDEPLSCWKTKKVWKFKCKSWIKKLINCCFSQIKTKATLTAYLMLYVVSFLIFRSTLIDIGQINWIFL